MIRNERELQAALQWLEYWRHNRSGEQSWIGNEQARQKVAEYRAMIAEYQRRTGTQVLRPARGAAPVEQPEAATHTVNRAASPLDSSD